MSNVDMIEELGHTVLEAGSAEDALVALEQGPVDVILTDVGLPSVSGIELARQVRDRWPAIKIVFASGDDTAVQRAGTCSGD